MQILNNFGIQPILLLAQIVNFLVILYVLRRFFYKPITKALDDRKQKIAESLKNAELIEQRLAAADEKTAEMLENAQKEVQLALAQAKEEAQQMSEAANKEAKTAMEDAITAAKAQIETQRAEMQRQLEGETMDLVAMVVKKLLNRSLSPKEKQQLSSKSLSELTREIS